MDKNIIKSRFGTILARIICIILGHEREKERNFYDFLDDGRPHYKIQEGRCVRCGK